MTPANDDVHLNPDLGREVLEQLLTEAEFGAELERIEKLTPGQLEEEMLSAGITPGRGREVALRAIEQANARRRKEAERPKRDASDLLDDVLEEAWVSRIGAMTPGEIKQLAAGSRLAEMSDQQIDAVLRRAKERMEEKRF